jgi:hypothetical protein
MIENRRLWRAGLALGAALLALMPSMSHADVDLFARRQACQAEAKTRLQAKGLKGRDLYEALVQRRRTYIAECMVMGPQHPVSTASTPPTPPTNAVAAKAVLR